MGKLAPAGALVLAGLIGGCADMAQAVRTQAAQELGCAEDRVEIVDEVAGIYRVRACGHEATYRCGDSVVLGRVECERLNLEGSGP